MRQSVYRLLYDAIVVATSFFASRLISNFEISATKQIFPFPAHSQRTDNTLNEIYGICRGPPDPLPVIKIHAYGNSFSRTERVLRIKAVPSIITPICFRLSITPSLILCANILTFFYLSPQIRNAKSSKLFTCSAGLSLGVSSDRHWQYRQLSKYGSLSASV